MRVGDDSDWASVAANYGYTLALKRDGSLWAWGSNRSGTLGLGDTSDRDRPTRVGDEGDWVSVAAGRGHAVALKRDGSLWAWGESRCGELGLGDLENRDRPTRVGDEGDWALVAAGYRYTVALKSDGSLWAWGERSLDGELGLGDAIHNRPVRLPRLRLRSAAGMSAGAKPVVGHAFDRYDTQSPVSPAPRE